MPTKNPRLTLTLSPRLSAQMRRLSELSQKSQASLISELLEGNQLVFDKLIKLLEAAKFGQVEMVTQFAEDMQRSSQQLEAQLGLTLDDIDTHTKPLLADVEQIKRRSGRSAVGGAPVTGGSRPSTSTNRRKPVPDPHLLTGGSKR